MTIKEEIVEYLEFYKETWEDVVACTLTIKELNEECTGKAFTFWTHRRVGFGIDLDTPARILSELRNPEHGVNFRKYEESL